MVSPLLQALIDNGLFDRIPASFSTFFFDQIKDWQLLFPAEQVYFERLFTLVDKLPPEEFKDLFSTLRQAEVKMGINEKTWPRRSFSLEQVDFLNRNPHYSEWRAAVAQIFSRLDPVMNAEIQRKGRPRLSVVLSPSELPVGPDRLWTRLKGRRYTLESPLDPALHLAPLLASDKPAPYDRWLIQAGNELPAAPGIVSLSYDELQPYRQKLTDEVQQIVEKEQLRGPRELGNRLKRMKVAPPSKDPLLAEFVRAVLLAGNGTLLINNTFVEWASVQAIRRARPSLTISSFGIRNKMKPFSSLLIYSDPEQTNPIPTQIDTLGTYVDLELLYLYVWQEYEKYAEYQRNTVHIFGAAGMDEILVIAPPDFALPAKLNPEKLVAAGRDWLQW